MMKIFYTPDWKIRKLKVRSALDSDSGFFNLLSPGFAILLPFWTLFCYLALEINRLDLAPPSDCYPKSPEDHISTQRKR